MPKRKVFISHSWENNEVSRKLAEYLKRDGADIWIDYSKIHGGDSLPRRISEALEWCDTLILLWSNSARDSYYVNLEWENALDLRKVIIPCLLDETKRPAILSRCLFIDFKNFDEGYRQLAFALDLAIQKEPVKKVLQPVAEKPKKEPQSHVVPPPVPQVIKPKILFRSEPATLSTDQVQALLKKYNFFDSGWNKNGPGFSHQFELKNINGEQVVLDKACGLMWQQGGAPEDLEFEKAKKWVADLNKKGYAGYHDWRLPTLEEAMSLMEPRKSKDGLYIDPIFNSEQWRIWTCDPVPGESRAWVVYFFDGGCSRNYLSNDTYVRAVRF